MKKLILAEGTEFEQNGKDLVIIETEDRAGIPVMLGSDEFNEAYDNGEEGAKALINNDGPNPTEVPVTVTPSINVQTINPNVGYVFNQVTVNAVTSDIDTNITANNIVNGVNILGVTGEAVVLVGETVNITPSINAQTITPNEGNGFTTVNISAVTSDIDVNIIAGNIKNGVTILGVTGTYDGTNEEPEE